ncbi:hydroxyisourate hydrolase [Paenibacillus albicereus]|uniref:5-hydroxyisourate hydrolase n=1 Tax=Paenibacillus albicereus TaxID=2726185 RepID=A0A6H2H1F0_9BACL|nr:hydroxyisourate hydrolase [Paenibacillus albicereus]QJC53429.1 hydroxyisourate hydrolase [Paenibacillus albicereus]
MSGKLTTHVLDTSKGGPAAGMALTLTRLAGEGEAGLLREALTNADGRIDGPLLAGDELTPGTYELLFEAGAYFRAAGVGAAQGMAFLEQIPIRFTIADASQPYHVPLIVAPGGYSSYRGS